MRRLLVLSVLVLSALAMPQSDDDFLSALLGETETSDPPADTSTDCCDIDDDTCFLHALTGGCSNDTETAPPLTMCQRGEFTCTPYYRCNEEHIVADQLDEFDLRIGKPQFEEDFDFITHSECPRFGDVCCTDPLPDSRQTEVPTESYIPQCGRRNEFGVGIRIFGFNESESQFAEFPWMAAVLRVEEVGGEERNFFECGGSLIHPQVVMTAAHCVNSIGDGRLRVRLGEWDTQAETELFLHQDIDVTQVYVHKDFHPKRLNDDIALLLLKRRADLSEHIDTLCLPDPAATYNQADCVATGWGKDSFQTGQFQTILKQVDLPLVPHAPCQSALRQTRLRKYFRLDRSFTCAGGIGGTDACTGDGGSPLACRDPHNPDQYIQLGIVSWGIGCGLEGVPGVYTDVAKQVPWIQRHLRSIETLLKL